MTIEDVLERIEKVVKRARPDFGDLDGNGAHAVADAVEDEIGMIRADMVLESSRQRVAWSKALREQPIDDEALADTTKPWEKP